MIAYKNIPTVAQTNEGALGVLQHTRIEQNFNSNAYLTADHAQVQQFVKAMFQYAMDGYVSLRAFASDGNSAGRWSSPMATDTESIVSYATRLATQLANAEGKPVFCPPVATFQTPKGAAEADLCLGLALSIDLDSGNPRQALEKLVGLIGQPTVVVESGGKVTDENSGEILPKLHVHWRLSEPTDCPEEHQRLKIARNMAMRVCGGDPSGTPLVHPFRWPGSWHLKDKPTLCLIQSINANAEIHLEDALGDLKIAVDQLPKSERDHYSEARSTARKPAGEFLSLQDEVRSGESYHEPLVRLSAHRISNGMNERAVVHELQALMKASEGPRDERWQSRYDDIGRIVRTALKFAPNPESEADISSRLDSIDQTAPAEGWQIGAVDADIYPDLSHDALALGLSKAGFSRDARYVHKWGKWLFWDGGKWAVDDRLLHMTATRDFLRGKAQKLMEWAERKAASQSENSKKVLLKYGRDNSKALRQAGNVASVESVARSNADLVATVDQFDADLMRLGTPGGTVDLKTGEVSPPQRDHWITKHCSLTPSGSGTTPGLWLKFLHRVLDGDQELIGFMQRAAGYALTGHTGEQKLLFLYGTGRNGKSVFLNTLFDIMGDYAKRAPAQTFLDSGGDRHPTDLAGLHGARLVAGSELSAGKAWNESIIKDLTGGDIITARFMRQDFFQYRPQFTLFIAGNHQPSFRGIDEAIRSRVVLVPFTQTIPAAERDPDLSEKLKAEWPAILRWMVDGAVAWSRYGLQVPDAVAAASAEYLDSEDSLGEFVADHIIEMTGGSVGTAEVYDRFTHWQRANGINNPWTKTAMTRALKERGIQPGKLAGGKRGFKGYILV